MKALQDAGRPIVPVTAFSYNGSGAACVQTEGAKCILGANPGWLGAQAIKLAVDILDGNKPADRHVLVNADFLTTDPIESELYPDNDTMQKLEIGKTAFPDLSPGLTLPISPDWMEITAQEAAGS